MSGMPNGTVRPFRCKGKAARVAKSCGSRENVGNPRLQGRNRMYIAGSWILGSIWSSLDRVVDGDLASPVSKAQPNVHAFVNFAALGHR